jgi:methyltransferase
MSAPQVLPPGMYEGPWRGARVIAGHWARLVATIGSAWTIDRLICDPGNASGRYRVDALQDG